MQVLVNRIKGRLETGSYPNEASVSHGIVMPLLGALGWDTSDPQLVMPEFTSGRGRVDFAICSRADQPIAFIEVKGVGRSLDGDRQLFEYAFHEGVPLCILTDGREWSFYLPSGQGSYEDRRVYRLHIEERETDECVRILNRYLSFSRIQSGEAVEDAQRDYRDASAKREAKRSIPLAWSELVTERDDLLMELLADKTEAKSGFRPSVVEVEQFLDALEPVAREAGLAQRLQAPVSAARTKTVEVEPIKQKGATRGLKYTLFGDEKYSSNANHALVEILNTITSRNPEIINKLALSVQTRSRNHIARTVAEIYPSRPDLARAEEFYKGWLIGLNIANREKLRIIKQACDVFGVSFGRDIKIDLPNAQ